MSQKSSIITRFFEKKKKFNSFHLPVQLSQIIMSIHVVRRVSYCQQKVLFGFFVIADQRP